MLKIRRIPAALVFLSFVSLIAAEQKPAAHVPTPSEFLGFDVGADRELADYRQITAYLEALAAASPRIEIETLGKTTLGADMIMAVISSPETCATRNATKKSRASWRTRVVRTPTPLTNWCMKASSSSC